MKLHGVFADFQDPCDLAIRQPVSDQRQYFTLAASQRLDEGFSRLCTSEPLPPRSSRHQHGVDVRRRPNQTALDIGERSDSGNGCAMFDLDPGAKFCSVFDCDPDDEHAQPTTHTISLAPVPLALPLALRPFADRDGKLSDVAPAEYRQ